MADRLLRYVVADLCIGKPALRPLSAAAVTVRQALAAIKTCEEIYLCVCSCKNHHQENDEGCIYIGKVGMVDIISFRSKKENLFCTSEALNSPLSVLLPPSAGIIKYVEPFSSLLDAIELVLKGAQNLVVPIQNKSKTKAAHRSRNDCEFCWLTQEDVIRFLLSSIGHFSPIAAFSIESLGLISSDFLAVWYDSPAADTIEAISHSLGQQTSVGVLDSDGTFVGVISPFTLSYCDETVAAPINSLSTGQLIAYIDCDDPPKDILKVVKVRLKERNLKGMLEEFEIFSTMSSSNSSFSSLNSGSDEEFSLSPPSPTTALAKAGKYSRSCSYSARMVRTAEAIVCRPESSLVAVMTQSITHRVNYVWVINIDYHLVGIVTFSNMLEVFSDLFSST